MQSINQKADSSVQETEDLDFSSQNATILEEEQVEAEEKNILKDGFCPVRSPKSKKRDDSFDESDDPHSSRFLKRENSVKELVEDFESKLNTNTNTDIEQDSTSSKEDIKVAENEEFPSFQDVTSPVNGCNNSIKTLGDTPISEFGELLGDKQTKYTAINSPFINLPEHVHPSMSLDKLTSLISPEVSHRKSNKAKSIRRTTTRRCHWSKEATEDGDTYWYNPKTNESVWELSQSQYMSKLLDILDCAGAEENQKDINVKFFDEVLKQITSINSPINEEDGKTIAHIVVEKHFLHGIKTLARYDANFNLDDVHSRTPLNNFLSSKKKIKDHEEIEIFQLLISAGADIASVDAKGNSCAHAAAGRSNSLLLRKILDSLDWHFPSDYPCFNENGDTPLHIAALEGNIENVLLLLKTTVLDPASNTQVHLAEYSNYSNQTADMCAETCGHILCRDRIRSFLEVNKWRTKAEEMEKLQQDSRKEVIELKARLLDYIEREESLNRKCKMLESELESWKNKYSEAETRALEAEKALIDPESAWVTMYTSTGKPYYYNNVTGESCWEDRTPYQEENVGENESGQYNEGWVENEDKLDPARKKEIVGKVWSKFFENALKVSEKKSRSAIVCLKDAINSLHPPTVMAALAAGADPEKDEEPEQFATPLHRCCSLQARTTKEKRDIVEIAAMLIDFGADVDNPGSNVNEGMYPLHIAAKLGNFTLLEFLLQHAASVHSVDANGDTPLHLAASGGTKYHLKCVQLLTRYGSSLVWCNAQGNTAGDCARRRMVLEDNPSRYLCETVNILQQLAKVAGDQSNPFSAPVTREKTIRNTEAEPNPYRMKIKNKHKAMSEVLAKSETYQPIQDADFETYQPIGDEAERENSWWSVLPNFLKSSANDLDQVPVSVPVNFDVPNPMSSSQLSLISSKTSKRKKKDRSSIGSFYSVYSALDHELNDDDNEVEEAYSANESVSDGNESEDSPNEDSEEETENELIPPEDVMRAIEKARKEQTYDDLC